MSAVSRASHLWMQLVRFGFYLLYNEAAFTYDTVSRIVSLGQWRCWGRTALPYLPPPSPDNNILELAYGTGNLHLDLTQAGYRVIGCDLSPFMARITHHKFMSAGKQPILIRGNALELPFASASFDAVVCTFPAPFIFEPDTVRELFRVLKPGTRLVIVVNAILTGESPLVGPLEWLYRITGQRAPEPKMSLTPPDIFEETGFLVQAVTEECPHSFAQLLVAEKPPEITPRPNRLA